jgi:hypothetical protein
MGNRAPAFLYRHRLPLLFPERRFAMRFCRPLSAALATALLLAVAALPRYASAQQAAPRSSFPQDPLRMATEVGRYLFAYDEAAGRATTMLLSEEASTDAVETTLARQREGGRWAVGFGRLTEDGRFELMHKVLLNEKRLVDEVRTGLGRQLPRERFFARAARAQQQVRTALDGAHGPYNLLVVPVGAEEGRMTVYALPAQTNQNAYRLGGDFRFEVDPAAGEIVSRTPLHEGYYEVGTLPQGTAASAHEAVRPVATDVLFATARRPKAPHFVKTDRRVYRIAPDGTITPVPVASFDGRSDVRMLEGM